jgi:protein phosphatase
LQRAIVETNTEIHRRGQANADFHNMGTTASALLLLPQGALVAHIGDSRVYRLRNRCLQQLTRDHSLVWELREQLADNSELSIPKNVITRSLGPNATVDVDIEGPLPLMAGDTFLLCSDGLTGRVSDEELGTILEQMAPRAAIDLLVDLANLRGGPDNITVIIAKVTGAELATASAQPLTVGRRHGPATVRSAVWVSFGVCLLGALVLTIIGNQVLALLCVLGATLALFMVQVARQRHKKSGVALANGHRLGKGPYTETPCPTPDPCVRTLRETTRELRTTNAQSPSLEWESFDALVGAGEQAEQRGQPAAALQNYGLAVRSLMQQVRELQNKRASDSSLEL